MANKLVKSLPQPAKGQWGIPDPAGTARGRLAQFRRGLRGMDVSQSLPETWAMGSLPGKEAAGISAGMAAYNAKQAAAAAKYQAQQTKNQLSRSAAWADMSSKQQTDWLAARSDTAKTYDEYLEERRLGAFETQNKTGWSTQATMDYMQGKGRHYEMSMQGRTGMTPAQLAENNLVLQEKFDAVDQALWRMATISGMGQFTDIGSLAGVSYYQGETEFNEDGTRDSTYNSALAGQPIIKTAADQVAYDSAVAAAASDPKSDAIEKFGRMKSFFYTWNQTHNNPQDWSSISDLIGLGVSSRTKEGLEEVNAYRTFVIKQMEFQGIPNSIINMALTTDTPMPLQNMIDFGFVHVGQVLTAAQARIYGYDLPAGTISVKIIDNPIELYTDENGNKRWRRKYGDALDSQYGLERTYGPTPAHVTTEEELLAELQANPPALFAVGGTTTGAETGGTGETGSPSAAQIAANQATGSTAGFLPQPEHAGTSYSSGEDFRSGRDWSKPQILSSNEAKYYFDMDSELPDDFTMTVQEIDGKVTILSQSQSGWTTNFNTDGTVDIISPDNVHYTQEQYDQAVIDSEGIPINKFEEGGEYHDLGNEIRNDLNYVNTYNDGIWIKHVIGNVNKQYDIKTDAGLQDFANSDFDTFLDIVIHRPQTEAGKNFLYDMTGSWQAVNELYSYASALPHNQVTFGLGNLDITDLNVSGVNSPALDLYNAAVINGSSELKLDPVETLAFHIWTTKGYTWDYCIKNRALISGIVNGYFSNTQTRVPAPHELDARFYGITIDVETDTTSQILESNMNPEGTITPYSNPSMSQWTQATYNLPTLNTIDDFLSFLQTEDGVSYIRDIGAIPENVAFIKNVVPGITDTEVMDFLSTGTLSGAISTRTAGGTPQNPAWSMLVDTFKGGQAFATNLWNMGDMLLHPDALNTKAYYEAMNEALNDPDGEFKGDKFAFFLGLASGQSPTFQALTEQYAPDWVKELGAWTNPIYLVPLGGIFRFTGISRLLEKYGIKKVVPGATPLMKYARSNLPKRFKSVQALVTFGERMGIEIRPINELFGPSGGRAVGTRPMEGYLAEVTAKKTPEEAIGGFDIIMDSQVVHVRNIREASFYFKHGNVEGIDSLGGVMPSSGIDIPLVLNGQPYRPLAQRVIEKVTGKPMAEGVVQKMRLYDTLQLERILEGQKWYREFVMNSPLYEAGNMEAIDKAILDCMNKNQLSPSNLVSFAVKFSKTIAETGPRVASQYLSTMKELCNFPFTTNRLIKTKLREEKGLYVSGIDVEATTRRWTDALGKPMEGPPRNPDTGVISLATNDVAQYHAYYVFYEQGAHDYFANLANLIEAIGDLSARYGRRFGRLEFNDVLEAANYLPRNVIGVEQSGAFIKGLKLFTDPTKERTKQFMLDGMEEGLLYDTLEHSIESYIKGVYRYIGFSQEKKLMGIFRKAVASQTLKGQILIKSVERAKAYNKNATKLVGLVKDLKVAPVLTGRSKSFLTRTFPEIREEVNAILALRAEVINVKDLDALVKRLSKMKNKVLTKEDKSFIRRKFPIEYTAIIDMLQIEKSFSRSRVKEILESRVKVLKAVNKEEGGVNSPIMNPLGVTDVGAWYAQQESMIQEMRHLSQDILKGKAFNIKDFSKELQVAYEDLITALKKYDIQRVTPGRVSKAKGEVGITKANLPSGGWYHGGRTGIGDDLIDGMVTRDYLEARRYADEVGGVVYEVPNKAVEPATKQFRTTNGELIENFEQYGFIKSVKAGKPGWKGTVIKEPLHIKGEVGIGGDIGYRAGTANDIAEPLIRMTSSRGTGHFGTGTYFFSTNEKAMSYAGATNRGVSEIDLSGLKLYKPKNVFDAQELHDVLKQVNYMSFKNDPPQMWALQVYSDKLKKIGIQISAKDMNKEILSVQSILRKNWTKWEKAETASTRVMRKSGYDGIDVRLISEADNSSYGSVVYKTDKSLEVPRHQQEAQLENINNQASAFLDRNFSELSEVSKEIQAEYKARLDDLVEVVENAAAEAKAYVQGTVATKRDFFKDLAIDKTRGEATVDIPRYHGWVFDELVATQRGLKTLGRDKLKHYTGQEVADVMKRAMDPHIDTWLAFAYKGMRTIVTGMTSIDLSAALTFGQYMMAHPIILGKSFALSSSLLLQPKILNMIRVANSRICEEYIPLGMKTAGDFNDFYAGLGYIRSVADKIPWVGKAAMIPFGRASIAFSGFSEIARIYTVDSMERAWLLAGGTKRELAEFSNIITCALPDMLRPSSKRWTLAEGAAMFAPNFLRANVLLLYRLKNGGIMGNELRKVMMKSWAGWEATYLALWYATGNTGMPHINPFDPDYLKLEYDGKTYGMPGFMPMLTRTMSKVFAVAADNPGKLIGISENGWAETFGAWEAMFEPALRSASYKLSPGLTFVREMLTGRNIMGQRLEGNDDYLEVMAGSFLPILATSLIFQDGPITVLDCVSNILNIQSYPKSEYQKYLDLGQESLKSLSPDDLPDELAAKLEDGTLKYEDLGYVLQSILLSNDPELMAAKEASSAASRLWKSDEYMADYNARQAIETEYGKYEIDQWAFVVSGEISLEEYNLRLSNHRSDDAVRKDQLKKLYPDLYAAFDLLMANNGEDTVVIDMMYDDYFDMVWGPGVMDSSGQEIDWVKHDQALADWKLKWDPRGDKGYYDTVMLMHEIGLRDSPPIVQRVWEMTQDIEPYWKVAIEDREEWRANPTNLLIEAELIFLGKTTTIENPNAEALVRQWCAEYGIDPDKTIPALTKLLIPDIMLQTFEGLQPNDMREYTDQPISGWARERYLVEHPAFKAYATSTDMIDGQRIGWLTGTDEFGQDRFTAARVPTVREEEQINLYKDLGEGTPRKLWRCTHRGANGEDALKKVGIITGPMDEGWCVLHSAETSQWAAATQFNAGGNTMPDFSR